MNPGMNWVDLVIIVALLVFVLDALGRPLILELLDFLSFLLALFVSFRYYNLPARFIENQFQVAHGLSLVLGFFLMWFTTEAIFFALVRLILPKIPLWKIPFSRTLSILPAFLRGLIFISLTLVLLATFPVQPSIKRAVQNSKIGSVILKNAYRLEAPVKQVFGGVANDTLTFLTIKPKGNERVNLGFQTSDFKIDPLSEQAMVDLVNKERIGQGLKALTFDERLRSIGRSHSEDMLKRGYFSHYSPEGENVAGRATRAGVDFLVIGENLAYAPGVELAHQGLINSEGHRANILSEDYGKVGIGVIDGGIYGKMFTQVFTN